MLRRSVDLDDRDYVLGDLDERFEQIVAQQGLRAARRWYRLQAARSVPALLRRSILSLSRPSGFASDVRVGARALLRRPTFTAGVVGTLALGLASACAVLLVLWKVWLAPLPFPDPGRVVRVMEVQLPETEAPPPVGDGALSEGWRLSPPLIDDMRRHEWSTLTAVAGVSRETYEWTRSDGASPVSAIKASPEIFQILGWTPSVGRPLTGDTSLPEVVLSQDFFERAFGADLSVVGSGSLDLNGETFRVVGVLDLPDAYPEPADLVAPLHFDEGNLREGMRGARYLTAVARVVPDRQVSDGAAELDTYVRTLGESHPNHAGWGATAVPLSESLFAPYRTVFALLLAAGLAFLALTAVNVAGLVASRRLDSARDRAVRLALGASRTRLLRLSLVESLCLGLVGGLMGLLGAYWLLVPVRALVPADVPRLQGLSLDGAGAVWIVAVGLGVGLVVGLLGHLSSGQSQTLPGGRASSADGWKGRRALVMGQVALTTLLVTGGAATLDEALSLRAVDTGFEPEGVHSTFMALSQVRYPDKEAAAGFWTGVLDGLEARDIEAAVAVNPPMSGSQMPFGFRIEAADEEEYAEYHTVSEAYFDVLGIDLVAGRAFTRDDQTGSEPVVIISESLARERFPDGSPIGRQMTVVAAPRTVVGVVSSTRHFGLDQQAPYEVYVPLRQDAWTLGHVLIKGARSDAGDVLGELVAALDPAVEMPESTPYASYLTEWFAPLRMRLIIVGTLALVGTILAALGIYALVAFHVSSRRRELGIRIALGAPGGKLFAGVLRQGIVMAGGGLAAGMVAWYAALPLLQDHLATGGGTGVRIPLAVTSFVALVTILATLAPARRSAAVDPVVTLKAE